ncbi:MAG: small acid-soluble spore protein SspI [Ignavibacteriales bacterium]
MKIDIRQNIINNFKNTNIEEIKDSIVSSISENDEITLPGLGVFFEILWNNSDDNQKTTIINSIKKGL